MNRHPNRHGEFRRELDRRSRKGDPFRGAIIIGFELGLKQVLERHRLPLRISQQGVGSGQGGNSRREARRILDEAIWVAAEMRTGGAWAHSTLALTTLGVGAAPDATGGS